MVEKIKQLDKSMFLILPNFLEQRGLTFGDLFPQGSLSRCSDEKTNSWSLTKHLNISCFERVSFVDSVACYASECGKFT